MPYPSVAAGRLSRLWWSLAGRIWLTNLIMVLIMAALGVVSISRLAVLERSVNSVLSRNYRSIGAGYAMIGAVSGYRTGDLSVERARAEFQRWFDVEQRNLTEPGEAELVSRIASQAAQFFDQASSGAPGARAFDVRPLGQSLRELIALNEHAMFSADRQTIAVARAFRTESLLLLLLSVIVLAASSYALSRTLVARPLGGFIDTLRSIDDARSLQTASLPRTAELAALADAFNAMVARLQVGYHVRVAEMDRERSKTAAIIESIEDGLIVLDRTGAIVHINEVARAILALEPDGLLGSTLKELAGRNSHVSRLAAAFERDSSGEGAPTEFKVFIRGRDHTYLTRRLPWTGPLPGHDGGGSAPQHGPAGAEPLGTIVLLQDVTFIRDQERARTNLIATLSHELKTPLTSLSIASDLLAESMTAELNPRQREILASLREDVGRLQTIANDLLDASRSSAARISVERRPIMLDDVLEEVCRPLAMQAEDKGIRFELTVADRPIPIWGDPIKLPWVVTNLVGNALRYTPENGRIAVELRRRDDTARIVVSDTGPGIARELIGRIFEPYAQFPDNPARAGSAGLGLYIAKEIVEAHDGRIFVESEPGRGSSFIVDIPLRDEELG